MDATEIIGRLEGRAYLTVGPGELEALLAGCELLRTDPAAVGEPRRTLRCGDRIIVQETSDRGEILLRAFADEAAAAAFVAGRNEVCDRMWDGCGCKIDWHD